MYLARSGSPGRRTASAYSPGSARTWIGMARDSTKRGRAGYRRGLAVPTLRRARVTSRCWSSARASRSSACSSRSGACGRSGASSRLEDDDGTLAGALPPRARTSCRPGAAAASSPRRPSRAHSRMIIGEERAVGELWARGGAADAGAARGPAGAARLRDHGAAATPGDTGLRPATLADLERLRARLRGRARAGARRRPAAARRGGLPLARRARRSRTAARGSGSRTA